jgi:Domain of unknown function (DUF4281)
MQPELIFTIGSNLAMIGWILLVFAPKWRWTKRIVIYGTIPLLLGIAYLFIIIFSFGRAEGGFGSLEGVQQLFQNPWMLLAGWLHYLAFDQFIGSWELSNAQKLEINHFLVIPCLLLTFFFGPVGLVLYFIIRWGHSKKFFHENF